MATMARRGRNEKRRTPRRGHAIVRRRPVTVLPWYLIVLGTAVAASTSAAQRHAVTVLSDTSGDGTDPLPNVAPDWMKDNRGARRLWTTTRRVLDRMGVANLSLVAAGIAFYLMFSVFPALAALVSIYGLFGDTHVVQAQVQQLTVLLPLETAKLINDSLNAVLAKPNSSLNFGLLVSLGIAIVAARNGVSSMMSGLNIAMERRETRSFLVFNGMTLLLTLGAIVFAIVALTAVAVIPIALAVLPIDEELRNVLAYSRWPLLGVFVVLAIDLAYRVGPCAGKPTRHLASIGTLLAAALWILGSYAFSLYVTRFGSYDTTYGSLGAVIVLLLWFWLSALIILLGAVIDSVRAEMRRTRLAAKGST